MITLRIDDTRFREDMRRFRKKSEADFKMAILRSTFDLVKTAKILVRNFTRSSKVRRGYLINGISPKIRSNGLTGEVTSAANYSRAFEEGTRPHIIRVRSKKVLAGPSRGAPPGWNISPKSASMGYATYGKQISHPGTNPRPFMFPAWKQAIALFENLMRRALS